MILGLGLDVVSVRDFAALLDDEHSRFRAETFTGEEAAYAERAKGGAAVHFAARFAAKEAALKALDGACALAGVHPPSLPLKHIEVRRDARGRPALFLEGEAGALAERIGADRAHLTLSHDGDVAAAVVVLERLA